MPLNSLDQSKLRKIKNSNLIFSLIEKWLIVCEKVCIVFKTVIK